MNKYYTVYPKFSDFAKEVASLDLQNSDDYEYNSREHIYERLRLPMRVFKGDKKQTIDRIVKKYFGFNEYLFSVIESSNTSQIHTDTHYKKDVRLQRFCNLAFPIKGNLENRITFWPKLDKQDSVHCFKNSYVLDESLKKYSSKDNWHESITHKLYQPVLLNTSLPHAAQGPSKTLFAYITLIGKSYEDCAALYTDISNSATT